MPAVMFIHGQESSSQTYKATLLRAAYPSALVPDFSGPLDERMAQLAPLLAQANDWVLIGSSMGGLMAALWAYAHPAQVRRLVLLAPALNAPEFTSQLGAPIAVPTVVYHGVRDTVVPLAPKLSPMKVRPSSRARIARMWARTMRRPARGAKEFCIEM